jgi:hypothetical protein
MNAPIKGITPKENKVICHPIMFVKGTAIKTPAETPSARPASLMPFRRGSSFGLNHSIVIALVAGIDIATPMPNASLSITNTTKESKNSVNKCADIKNPAIVIALFGPIFPISAPPGMRATVITIIVAETNKLTELLPIS